MDNEQTQRQLETLDSPQRSVELKPAELLTWAGLKPAMQVVDLGAGGGFFAVPAALQGAHVTAVDPDQGLLYALRIRAVKLGLGIELAVSTAENWLDRQSAAGFDLAILSFVIHERPLRERELRLRLLHGIHYILKPSGKLLVVEFRRRAELTMHGLPEPEGWVPGPEDYRRVGPVDLADLGRMTGLHIEQIQDLPPICYAALLAP